MVDDKHGVDVRLGLVIAATVKRLDRFVVTTKAMSTYAERVKILQTDLWFLESFGIALDVADDIAAEAGRKITELQEALMMVIEMVEMNGVEKQAAI